MPQLVRLVCLAVLVAGCGSPIPTTSPSTSPSVAVAPSPAIPSPSLEGPAGTIAFSARIDSPTDGDIYTVDTDGQNLRRLTSSPANEYSASWSPDGQRIVFRSAPSSERVRAEPKRHRGRVAR